MAETDGGALVHQFSNIYFTILALFCFKIFLKLCLALLSHYYIVRGNRKEAARIAKEFYDYGSLGEWTPLHEAARNGRLQVLQTLLTQPCDVNAVTFDLHTPLHEACRGGHVACVRELVHVGAKIHAISASGSTPLSLACAADNVACVSYLMLVGANPHSSPLHSPIHLSAARGKHIVSSAINDRHDVMLFASFTLHLHLTPTT
uniref:Uncharacterized protein n=1 Tax=Eptatretus burgeri TaxID=7764 RepID=A0A8C4R7N3_EPTBU